MQIGQRREVTPQTAKGGRLDSFGGRAATPQVADLGAGLQQGARALAGIAGYLHEEDRKRRDFDALRRFTELQGEVSREADAMQTSVAPDGSGYMNEAATLFEKRFGEFIGTVDEDLADEFRYRGEVFRQSFLTNAARFEADALRGNSISVLNSYYTDNIGQVYADPAAAAALEEELGRRLAAAPGLTEADRRDIARKFTTDLDETRFSGEIARGLDSREVMPGSPESEALFGALLRQESGANPNVADSLPHPVYGGRGGALGIAQVMLETGREIAGKIDDKNFPFAASDDIQKKYLRKNSARYGRFYLNEGLRMYDGDVVLALLRYNGGAGAVEEFVRGGRNPAVLDGVRGQTREYVEKIFEREGWGNPWVSPGEGILARTPEQIAAVETLRETFDAARLAGATAMAEVDQARLQQELNEFFTDTLTRVFANPTKVDDEIDTLNNFLEESGVAGPERERVLGELMPQINTLLAEAEQNPDAILDTENYPGITLETRRRLLDRELGRRTAKRNEELAAAETARAMQINRAMGLAEAGVYTYEDLAGAVESGTVEFGSPKYLQIKGHIDTFNKKVQDANAGWTALSRGATYLPKAQLESVSDEYSKGVVQNDSAATEGFIALWGRLGQVSPQMRGALDTLLESPRAQDKLRGMQLLDQMAAARPGSFNDQLRDYEMFRYVYRAGKRQGLPDDKILEMIPHDPAAVQRYEQRLQRADEAFMRLGLDAFADGLGGTWVSSGIEIDPNDRRMVTIEREVADLWRSIAPFYGDEKDAIKETKKILEERFDTFNGHFDFMPPNMTQPEIEGGHDWVNEQFIRTVPRQNVKAGTKLRFETNPWNEAEYDSTGRRTYTVVYTQDNAAAIAQLEAMPELDALERLSLAQLQEQDGMENVIPHWLIDPDEAMSRLQPPSPVLTSRGRNANREGGLSSPPPLELPDFLQVNPGADTRRRRR